MVIAAVLAIVSVTLAVLAVITVGLTRHVKVLAASVKRFQEETQPMLDEIQRAAASAARRGAEFKGSGDRLRR
jgi:hypothetical protein